MGCQTPTIEGRGTDSGFTVVEALVAAVIGAILLSATLAAAQIQLRIARSHPAAIDVSERARALGDVLVADVLATGSGVALADGQAGLSCCLPTVNPRRIGFRSPDPPGTARDDVITLTYVPRGSLRARLTSALSSTPVSAGSILDTSCSSLPNCGLGDRDDVIVFDGMGNHDYFRVSGVGASASLIARQPTTASPYGAGTSVARVETHTYYFDEPARQLRHYDGYLSDTPVIDNVVQFRVEYWGEDRAPRSPVPPVGTANCLYDSAGTRLPWPSAIGSTVDLVPLSLASFSNGPWCGAGDNRFDADLLRIRRIRFVATVQAPDAVRASGALFVRPGAANAALSLVPDLPISIDVTPRSLNAGR